MKLKLHIPETGKTIKIKDICGGISFGVLGKMPKIIFSVNIQDELLLLEAMREGAHNFTLLDSKKREYIHGSCIVLREHYYEKGTGEPRASYELLNLKYKDFGLVSLNFLKKQFKKVSNRYQFPEKKEPPPTNRPSWWPNYKLKFMRIFERLKAHKRKLKFFQDLCRFYLKHLNITEETLKDFEENIPKIISVAPT